MVQHYGVHGLAYLVVTTERERQVAYAARHVYLGHLLVYRCAGSNEGATVVVVLRHTRSHGKHVRVEDDVLGRETYALQQFVGTACHCHFTLV